MLYRAGYIYRYWQLTRNIGSNAIIKLASAETMNRNYTLFHTMDPEMAIDSLMELHNQKKQKQRTTKTGKS